MELLTQLYGYVSIAMQVVGVAAIVAAATPTPKDDNIVAKAKSILDLLAFNIGFARNQKP